MTARRATVVDPGVSAAMQAGFAEAQQRFAIALLRCRDDVAAMHRLIRTTKILTDEDRVKLLMLVPEIAGAWQQDHDSHIQLDETVHAAWESKRRGLPSSARKLLFNEWLRVRRERGGLVDDDQR